MRSSEGKLSKDTMIIQTVGHSGELQTFNVVKEHYWWPGLQVFIKNYVQGCGTCQQFKIDRNPSKPAFVPIKGAKSTRLFASCYMDRITDLPPVNDCDSILVMVDRGNTKGQFSSQRQKL
jgi:hypothetical protein